MHYREIKYGFEWGSAKITRFFSDEKAGWVTFMKKMGRKKSEWVFYPRLKGG